MSLMRDVYNTLRTAKYFIDNEYLLKYAQIIERNAKTLIRGKQTHKHHILPKCWFKLTDNEINNDLNNLVNLPCREHFLAHYYLCLCTEDPFRYANELALQCLLSNSKINIVDKQLLKNLPLYNNICEDLNNKLKENYKIYDKE